MSKEHKEALARGRVEARAVKSYLKAIEARKPGRPVTKESLQQRLDQVIAKIEDSDNPLTTVDLVQRRLDLEKSIKEIDDSDDLEALESAFVDHVKSYSERKAISYTAWRQMGVPARVLKMAGIRETRRR